MHLFLYILSLASFMSCTIHCTNIFSLAEFVPHIDKLFDENLLFGHGWTAHDTLRPLAYSTLADLVHHVR